MVTRHPSVYGALTDNRYYLNQIKRRLSSENVDVFLFDGPYDFIESCSESMVNNAALILVDYDFKHSSSISQDVAGYIREKFPKFEGKLALLSVSEKFNQGDSEKIEIDYDYKLSKHDDFEKKILDILH